MEENILDGKYKITLDAIDINMLRRIQNSHTEHSNDTIPLWSCGNLEARREYYEFEAFFERTELKEDSDSECDENNDKQICHICNIDIPKSYIKEHNSSNKHQTCLAIAKNAFERIKDHMTQGTNVPPAKTDTSIYFCEPCALVVKLKNKANHDKSKDHTISATQDRLLNNMLMMYVDKDKFYNDFDVKNCENYETVQNNDGIVKDEDTNACVQEFDKNKKTIKPATDIQTTDDARYTLSNENKIAKIKEFASEVDELDALEEYIKLLSNFNKAKPKHSLSAVDEDEIEIKTMSGDRVHVFVDNFHGYYKVGEYMQCRVCRVLVDNIESHKMLPDHIEKITAPIKNKHCVRQLNEIWNHCILCNEIIENIDLHVQCSELHSSLLIEAVVTKETRKKKRKVFNENERVYCEVCNVTMLCSLSSHQRGMKHRHLLKQKQLSDDNVAKPVIHFHMKKAKDSDEVTCRICDVVVTNVTEHISDDDHIDNYNKLLIVNKIIIFKDRFCCEVCQAYIMEEYVLYHVDGKNHKKKLNSVDKGESDSVGSAFLIGTGTQQNRIKETKLKKSNKHFEVIFYQLRCKVCDILIENDKNIAKIHRKSSNHEDNLRVLLEKNEMEKHKNRLLCKLCKTTFRKKSTLSHIDSKTHKMNLYNHKNSLDGYSIEAAAPIVEDEITVQPNVKLIEMREAKIELKETDCQQTVNIESSVENGSAIRNEQRQTSSLENTVNIEKLVINKLPEVEDEICYLLTASDHVTNDNHKSKVLNSSVSTNLALFETKSNGNQLYEVDKGLDLPEATSMSAAGAVYEQNLTESTFVDVKDECSASETDLQDVSIRYLIESSNNPIEFMYKSSEEIVLAKNKLTKIDDNNYFCDICTVLVPDILKFDHIYCDDHKDKLNELCQYSYSDDSQSTNLTTDNDNTCEMTKIEITQPAFRLINTLQAQSEPTIKHNYTEHDTVEENCSMKTSSMSIERKSELNSDFEINKNAAVNVVLQQTNINTKNHVVNEQKYIDSTYLSPPGNYIMETTKNLKEVTCKACKITLPNTEENIKEHSYELRHISNYNFIMSTNKLNICNGNFFCKCCYTCVTKSYAFLHIDSYIHKNNLMKVTSPILVPSNSIVKDTIDANNQVTEPAVPTNDENNKINLPKVQLHYMMTEDTANSKQVIKCKLCDVKVPYRNIDEHVTGFNHSTNYTSLLIENKLKKSNNKLLCFTCNVDVPEKGEFEHINGRNHQTNLSKNKTDNKSKTMYSPKSQHLHYLLSVDPTNPKFVVCKMCNIKVNHVQVNVDEHLKGLLHTNNHVAFLLRNKLKRVNENIYCELCRAHIPETCILDHIEGSKHTASVSNQVTGHTSKSMTVIDQNELHYMLSIDTKNINQVFCKVCNVNVPYLARNIDEHMNGSNHTNNYNVTLIKNKLKKANELIHCEACNVNMSQKFELKHIVSSTHTTNLSNNTGRNDTSHKSISNTNNIPGLHFMMSEFSAIHVICRVCKVRVPNSEKNIDIHMQGSNHTNSFKAVLNENKLKMVEDRIRCELCNLHVCIEIVFDHIKSNIHRSNYAKNKSVSSVTKDINNQVVRQDFDNVVAKVNAVNIQSNARANPRETISSISQKIPVNVQKSVTKQRLHYLMETTKNPKELSCKICNCRVAIRNDLVTIHIEGSRHISNYNSILDTNKLKKIADAYYCNVCTCFVVVGQEFDHMSNRKHAINLVNYCQPSTSGISLKLETKQMENDTKNEERTQKEAKLRLEGNDVAKSEETAKVVHYLMQSTKDMQYVCCKICKVLVPSATKSIHEHITGSEHNAVFSPIINENNIKRIDNNQSLICERCDLILRYADVLDHIHDENHKNNVPKTKLTRKAEEFCKVCQIYVVDMKAHVVGKNHLEKKHTKEKITYFCEVCELELPNNDKAVELHVDGARHKTEFKNVLTKNSIKIRDDRVCFCEVCNLYFTKLSLLKHINSVKHKWLS